MECCESAHLKPMVYLHVLFTTLLSFASLWVITRVLGQKQISQLTLFDYITGITIGSVAAELISPEGEWKPILLSLFTWGALAWAFHKLGMVNRTLHRVMDGSPAILIRNGKILEKQLGKMQLPLQELMSMLRDKGFFNLEEVEFALLETNGALSVLPKSQFRPMQPRDLKVKTAYEGLTAQVMQEGMFIDNGIKESGYSKEWLERQLENRGLEPREVFAAWIMPDGRLLMDLNKDERRH